MGTYLKMARVYGQMVILALLSSFVTCSQPPDWLVYDVKVQTTLEKTGTGSLLLTNGLIAREFITTPGFSTIDFYSFEQDSSLLRALSPEAIIALDGITYNVGGIKTNILRAYLNRSALVEDVHADPQSFQFVQFNTMAPVAPFPYKPNRGAPKTIQWPPKGLRMDVQFRAPSTAPAEHQGVKVTVHYEMYVGIPLLSKWLTVQKSGNLAKDVRVSVWSVEELHVNWQWADQGYKWLYVETDQPHGTLVTWGIDPAAGQTPGSFEPFVNCSYQLTASVPLENTVFESFRVHELLIGSDNRERTALARHRLTRLLAPHTQENPIFFHMTDSSSSAVRKIIDQMADVGFEMMIYSFGSSFNLESTDPNYISKVAGDITYAKSKGIEVGGYDLIALTRSVKAEWMAVDNNNKSIGSACFASGWYDELLNQTLWFMNKTGLIMVETDGPYGGYACSSTSHSHHTNHDDSIYWQNKLQGDFYRTLRAKAVYINQPDNYFYQGGSKTGMGYNENQYSLPRWQDISVSRQGMFDDTFIRIPTQGWMFVPLVDYHGGGSAASIEPLCEHLPEYEWSLSQYLGAGVAACYRGYRLYDTNTTRGLVKKWVSFYKAYRDILTSDIIHVRRADMQSIDCYMHVNPVLNNKGLAMVFNPTLKAVQAMLKLPLYYTGLTNSAKVSERGQGSVIYTLNRDYSITVPVNLPPRGITWLLVQ